MSTTQGQLITTPRRGAPTLENLLARFLMTDTTIQSPHTVARYRSAVRFFSTMLGREATIDDLTDENLAVLTRWLQLERQQVPRTCNSTIGSLIKFWRWCREKDFVRTGPTIKPLKVAKRAPRAYSPEEVAKLVEAAKRQRGAVGDMPAAVWWLTALQLILNTGARSNEILSFRWEWIDWNTGWLRVPAEVRKGKVADMVYGLWQETVEWLRPIRKEQGLILGWQQHMTRYYQIWGELLREAGLPADRFHKAQALRRTFATAIHFNGGDASKALGHHDPRLAHLHYIDQTRGDQERHADVIPDALRPLSIAKLTGEGKAP